MGYFPFRGKIKKGESPRNRLHMYIKPILYNPSFWVSKRCIFYRPWHMKSERRCVRCSITDVTRPNKEPPKKPNTSVRPSRVTVSPSTEKGVKVSAS